MADPLLEEAKRLSEAATPGQWWAVEDANEAGRWYVEPEVGNAGDHGQADAEFIARARTLIPELVERVERAEVENASLREMLREEYMTRLNMPAENREQDVAAVDARIDEALAAHHQPTSERGETAG